MNTNQNIQPQAAISQRTRRRFPLMDADQEELAANFTNEYEVNRRARGGLGKII
jgi:hypothetical protein